MSSGEKPAGLHVPRPPSGGPIKFGPFWLDTRLAVGGTAEVYLARPIDPTAEPRLLVVKRLLPHFLADMEGRTMFEREAALHAAVCHENVVKVFGFGNAAGGEPWIAMEYIEGCDLFHLLRRLTSSGRVLGVPVATYIAREILRALESVHTARDAAGEPMGIVHRDVTPSNVYLASAGRVTLGDFGIARSTGLATQRSGGSAILKGKFAYLAPEQVAGDAFDHRADLFAVAAVLTEMLIGQPLFGGSGQLAVLLAIRDCRIDPLREARSKLPAGLFDALERGLARNPADRTPSATAMLDALASFDTHREASRAELGVLVRWVQAAPSVDQMQAVRDSAAKLRAQAATAPEPTGRDPTGEPAPPSSRAVVDSERATGEYASIPSLVVTARGSRLGPWPFARLVEAIATGQIGRGDAVDYLGRGLCPVEEVDDLARFLPSQTAATTNRVASIAAPDFVANVSPSALVTILVRVVHATATGVLFAEGPADSERLAGGESGRKELYFVGGRLHHVASNNASELLGEYLVRRKVISRGELDFALAVLPRYNGRMGDTLISLGLVGSLDVFRAIRDQGRDRVIDLFQWRSGKLAFYAEQTAPHVDFALDLDVLPLIFSGMEASAPGETPVAQWRGRLDEVIGPGGADRVRLGAHAMPPVARHLLDIVRTPMPLRDVLSAMAQTRADREAVASASQSLRAIDVLVGAGLLRWR